jgi:hypothetical protein
MAHPLPHYLRFAAALAMVSASGCALEHGGEGADGGPSPDAGPVADVGNDAAPFTCGTCACVFGGDLPPPMDSCEAVGHPECCYAVGPLPPPELA